jgi:integrase/recombinase XerD
MATRTRKRAESAVATSGSQTRIDTAFEEYLTFLLNSGRSDGYAGPRGQLNLFLGQGNPETAWKPLGAYLRDRGVERVAQIDGVVLDAWLEQLRDENLSQYSYAKAVTLMKRFLKWLVEEDELERIPIKVKTPRAPDAEIKVFTEEEMTALHKVARRENVRDYAIFMLLVDTGMRANEICRLTLDDVRLDRSEIYVPGEITKPKRGRQLTLTTSLGPLKKYLQVRPAVASNSLFLSFYSTPVYAGGNGNVERMTTGKLPFSDSALTTKGLAKLVGKWGKLAEVVDARCSPHTFRHYYAISYLRGGGDVLSLQRLLGHKELEMTMRYAKLADVDLRKQQQKFSPALRFAQNRFNRAGQ